MPSFFLSLALAATFVVPEDGSLHDALDDPQFSLIQIQDGQTLADETPFTIDRDLTIEGLGEVELPPLAAIGVTLTISGVKIIGQTEEYAPSAQGTVAHCALGPCTVLQSGGRLVMSGVVLDDSASPTIIHTIDADVELVDVVLSGGTENALLIVADEDSIEVTIEGMSLFGDSGAVKILQGNKVSTLVTVTDSTFVESAPALSLDSVSDFTISNSIFSFTDETDEFGEAGALRIVDSAGRLEGLTFSQGPGVVINGSDGPDGRLEVASLSCTNTTSPSHGCLVAYDLPHLSIEGLVCKGTFSEEHGGCLAGYRLQDLQVNSLEAHSTGATGSGGVIYLEGAADGGTTAYLADLRVRGSSSGSGGGALYFEQVDVTLGRSRFCGTATQGTGSAVFAVGKTLTISNTAIQSTEGGPSLFAQEVELSLDNMTFVSGDHDFIDGYSALSGWSIKNSIFFGDQEVTGQLDGPELTMNYNLFSDGAWTQLGHGDGYITQDALFLDADPWNCDAAALDVELDVNPDWVLNLVPGPGSPAIDGNPTEPEPDGSGLRDLGWIWGQSEKTTDTETLYEPAGMSGGCSVSPAGTGVLAVFGLLFGVARRRC